MTFFKKNCDVKNDSNNNYHTCQYVIGEFNYIEQMINKYVHY